VLDTHILVWWRIDPAKLSGAQGELLVALERQGEPLSISAISLWELAKMVECRRLQIDRPLDMWLAELENHPLIRVLPITAQIAAESVQLGEDFHRDPADQIIVATARCLNRRLLTGDERIRRWGKVMVL
jgi:PIN domain nuclease of toxin-antitoxin system